MLQYLFRFTLALVSSWHYLHVSTGLKELYNIVVVVLRLIYGAYKRKNEVRIEQRLSEFLSDDFTIEPHFFFCLSYVVHRSVFTTINFSSPQVCHVVNHFLGSSLLIKKSLLHKMFEYKIL